MADRKRIFRNIAFSEDQWKVIESALAEHRAVTGVKLSRSYGITMIVADWLKIMTEPKS